uniref:RNA-directed RNA polymerase catalytic subunit n=1 Tax=Hubei orthomyxo-like virus 2 TaxID=1923006 RepID=A0A1L3KKE9_9VIRU|nr:polymerase PB1 [Hubei orthomyxo-like virus 2]
MDEFRKYRQEIRKDYKLNGYLISTLLNGVDNKVNDATLNKGCINQEYTNGIHMISGLYQYTNAPPYGHGTPCMKAVETVKRAYEFNLKKDDKTFKIGRFDIEDPRWHNYKDFPFDQTAGNFNPTYVKNCAVRFLIKNQKAIDNAIKKTANMLFTTNADIISNGRQTWDPETMRSITSPKAFDNLIRIININLNKTPTTMFELLIDISALTRLDTLRVRKRFVSYTLPILRKKKGISYLRTKRQVRYKDIKIEGNEEVFHSILNYMRSFASYIKHGERGKKDRRAIASANSMLRLLLKIVEEFSLTLCNDIPGATISIGGDEKKRKITTELSGGTSDMQDANYIQLQGTEDATKWNECMSPLMFAIIFNVFLSNKTRVEAGISPINEELTILNDIFMLCFMIMGIKRIHLGTTPLMTDGTTHSRPEWFNVKLEQFNKKNQELMEPVWHLIDKEGYMEASPGFLMGMLNAASTIVGLLPTDNWDKLANFSRVTTLRSSDDSMSVFSAKTPTELLTIIEADRRSRKLHGINNSKEKTIYCPPPFGEYTSTYQDGSFVAQYGVETSSLKPGGANPQQDFDSVASNVRTLLRTQQINFLGAISRLSIGIKNVCRLYRISQNPDYNYLKGVSRDVIFLASGGDCPWNITNLFFNEATLRFYNIKNEADKEYFYKVMNPDNPFSGEPEEQIKYSKDAGQLIVTKDENPVNIYSFIRRSNKTLNNQTAKREAEKERAFGDAYSATISADPSLMIKAGLERITLANHIASVLMLKAKVLEIGDNQMKMVEKAIKKLKEETNYYNELEEDDYVMEDVDDDIEDQD